MEQGSERKERTKALFKKGQRCLVRYMDQYWAALVGVESRGWGPEDGVSPVRRGPREWVKLAWHHRFDRLAPPPPTHRTLTCTGSEGKKDGGRPFLPGAL